MELDGQSCFRYFMTPNIPFFKCKRCFNHIALYQGATHWAKQLGLLKLADEHTCRGNWNVRNPENIYMVGGCTSIELNCSQCELMLGWTIVGSQNPADAGRYILYLDNLLYWNGSANLSALQAMEHLLASNNPP